MKRVLNYTKKQISNCNYQNKETIRAIIFLLQLKKNVADPVVKTKHKITLKLFFSHQILRWHQGVLPLQVFCPSYCRVLFFVYW